MSLLEVKNLHVEVEDKKILNGLTLTVETTDGRRVGKVLVDREHREHRGDEDESGD